MPTVETNGVATYYEEYGEGQPVIFLHGATSDHQLWAEQLQPLTDDFRIIVYDLRGHGKTETSSHDAYTIDLYAEDLAALIDSLDVDTPVICGLSMGGMIGYWFASTRPEQPAALITLGAATPQTFSLGERFVRVYLNRLITPIIENDRLMRGLQWAMGKAFRDSSTVDLDDVDQIREGHHCEPADRTSRERAKILAGTRDYMMSSINWQNLTVPTLVMYGENEPFIENHAVYLRQVLDDCRTAEIPDASHNSHVDNPEFIRKELRTFLTEVKQYPEEQP